MWLVICLSAEFAEKQKCQRGRTDAMPRNLLNRRAEKFYLCRGKRVWLSWIVPISTLAPRGLTAHPYCR